MRLWLRILLAFGCLIVFGAALSAQERPVTMDEVYAVAEKMYCPICENEPLDDCRAATCVQWREEIRQQLAAGRTEDEIIADFVDRFGQHVVGIPQDQGLRLLSLLTPVIMTLLVVAAGVTVFLRWNRNNDTASSQPASDTPPSDTNDYRQQLERDLSEHE